MADEEVEKEKPTKYGWGQDFQRLIVAAALKDEGFLGQYGDVLQPQYFDFEYLGSVIRRAKELYEKLDSLPTKATIKEAMVDYCAKFHYSADDLNFVLDQLDVIYQLDVTDLAYVRDKVVEFGQRQAIKEAVGAIVTLYRAVEEKDVHLRARSILEKALQVGLDVSDMGFDFYSNVLQIPELASTGVGSLKRKVPTGIKSLDQNTLGGPGRGEVWAVVGHPGRGKSAFLVNIGASALTRGYPVFHYTVGDLHEIDVAVRYAARLTGCSVADVLNNSEQYVKQAEKLSKFNPHLIIKYYPAGEASVENIRAHAQKTRAVDGIKPGVIIIDYPEELRRPFTENLYLSGDATYSRINSMGNEFDCVMWVASQPKNLPQMKSGRGKKKQVITGDLLGESARKFQKLDGLVSWNMDYDEEREGVARLWNDKTRRGKAYYMMYMKVNLDKMFIREMTGDEKREYLEREDD
jgi:hypothetical protein